MSSMKTPSKNLVKYPWSIEAADFIRKSQVDLNQLKREENQRIIKRTINRIKHAIDNHLSDDIGDPISELLSYPLAIAFVAEINDSRLKHRFATSESKRSGQWLQEEEEDLLIHLARTTFKWTVEKIRARKPRSSRRSRLNLAVRFEDFLKISPSFHASEWKLINQQVEKGNVHLNKQKFVRLLEENVKVRLLETKAQRANLTKDFPEPLEELKTMWGRYQKKFQEDIFEKAKPSAFPPCINKIFTDVKRGIGVSHVARFTLASFLLTLNWKPDEIVDLFGSAPDFRRDFAQYQVEHIAGGEGGTRYTPPGCDHLVTNQLCHADEYCKRWRVKHPLSYYRKKTRISRKPSSIPPTPNTPKKGE
ncbi:MAG: hypothetical protein ACW976_01150 [Candidatus Ranarchaeia archaeon]|jgi:DNA primase large subunit